MSAHEQDLVLGVLVGILVQPVDIVLETLPESLLPVPANFSIGSIGAVNQAVV